MYEIDEETKDRLREMTNVYMAEAFNIDGSLQPDHYSEGDVIVVDGTRYTITIPFDNGVAMLERDLTSQE